MEKPGTPLPWRAVRQIGDEWWFGEGDQIVIHADSDLSFVVVTGGNSDNDMDAAYIVQACNAYPRLTAINAELVDLLDAIMSMRGECFIPNENGWSDDRALAALARAKEASHDAD